MRHLAKLIAATAVTGLVATACGGAANVLQGKTPTQIVRLASTSLTASAYRMQVSGKLAVDTSGVTGVPQAEIDQFARMFKNLTVDGTGEVENSTTMRFSMTLKPAVDKAIVVVLYGGHAYVSQDGGRTFADGGSLSSSFKGLPVSPQDLQQILGGAADVTDLGQTTRNGNRVEHMRIQLGPDYLGKVLSMMSAKGDASSAETQMVTQFLQQVMTLRSGTFDAYVRTADGKTDSIDGHIALSIDMGKLMGILQNAFAGGAALGGNGRGAAASSVGGTIALDMTMSGRMYDYGASIHIAKPVVDPAAPTLPPGGIFGA